MREILFKAKAINRDTGYHRTKYKNGDWVLGHKCKLAVYRDIDIDEALKECLNDRN